jgi:hypothetical protein
MAGSLGMVVDGPENAAETVKAALTVQANLAGEAMPGVRRIGWERGVPTIAWRRKGENSGEVLGDAGCFQGARGGKAALDGRARLDHCAPP